MNHPVYLQFVFKNLYEKFLSVIQVVENVTFNSIEQRVIDYLKEHSRGGLLYRTHE